jgi:hypothetical protein
VDHPGPNAARSALLVTDGDVNTLFVHKIASLGTLRCNRSQVPPYTALAIKVVLLGSSSDGRETSQSLTHMRDTYTWVVASKRHMREMYRVRERTQRTLSAPESPLAVHAGGEG